MFGRVGKGLTKPLAGARINWGHPLARGLVSCYLFNERAGSTVADLCNILSSVKYSANLAWTPENAVLPGGGAPPLLTSSFFPASSLNAHDYSFSLAGRNSAGNNWWFSVGNGNASDQRLHVGPGSSTSINFAQFNDDLSATVPSIANARFNAIGTVSSQKKQKYYHNGVFINSQTISGFLNCTNIIQIGADGGANGTAYTIEHLMFWGRELSAEEIRQFSNSPYDMFINGVLRRYILPGSTPLTISVSDSFTLSDSQIIQFVVPLFVNTSDTISISDTLSSIGAGVGRSVLDVISFSELVKVASQLQIQLNDSLTIADAVQLLLFQSGLTLSDVITLSDSTIVRLANVLNIQLSDSFAFSDSVNILLNTAFTSYIRRYLNDVI